MHDPFVAPRRSRWQRLEELLARGAQTGSTVSERAALYRAVASDLAAARTAGVSPDVLAYLDDLAARSHHAVYTASTPRFDRAWDAIARGFPQALRQEAALFAFATLLFYGPAIGCGWAAATAPGFAESVLGTAELAQLERSYAEATVRPGDGDAAMAGFYVLNNVGIALRCFATGAFAGLGPLFFLVYNGVQIGTVVGYLGRVGLGGNLASFAMGHGPWELTAVTIAGTAGLRLGIAIVAPDGSARTDSLRRVVPHLTLLVSGSAVMLLVAAAIEGFWSASPVPWPGRIAFAVVQAVIVAVWLMFGGRK